MQTDEHAIALELLRVHRIFHALVLHYWSACSQLTSYTLGVTTYTQHGVVPLAENKTKPTDASIEDYLASRANEHQRADCQELMALLQEITHESPRMWGPSIVGYGVYRYTYESGRTGEAPVAAFAIRGRDLVVYITAESDAQKSRLSKLGRHKMGKSCLYFRRLADLDKDVLEQLVTDSVADARRRYG